jgi:GntR family transcriptional regulator
VGQEFVLTIDRAAAPLHAAITQALIAAIEGGRLEPGTRLPPERELAASLGVSRMTVRQALGDLEREGRLRRVVGRAGGTFVAEPEAQPAAAPAGTSLSEVLRRSGGASGVEVVSAVVEQAGRRVASALELARDDRVVVITRLRLAGGKPLGVERSSLPAKLFPDAEEMDLAGSLPELMVAFGVWPVRVVERLELTEARPQDVRALGVRRAAPLYLVERIRFTADGTPVEFARDRFRCDRTHIVMESASVGE